MSKQRLAHLRLHAPSTHPQAQGASPRRPSPRASPEASPQGLNWGRDYLGSPTPGKPLQAPLEWLPRAYQSQEWGSQEKGKGPCYWAFQAQGLPAGRCRSQIATCR